MKAVRDRKKAVVVGVGVDAVQTKAGSGSSYCSVSTGAGGSALGTASCTARTFTIVSGSLSTGDARGKG